MTHATKNTEGSTHEVALAALKQAMAAHTAPHLGLVCWPEVARCAALVLQHRPDLKVACYGALAQSHTQGVVGCAEALTGLAGRLQEQWDTLVPPPARSKGRLAALTWLHEELGRLLSNATPASSSAHQRLSQATAEMDNVLSTRFAGQAPCFALLMQRVSQQASPKGKLPKQPETKAPEPSHLPPTAPSPADGATHLVPDASDLTAWGALLLARADAWLTQDPLNESAHRLRRQGLWLHIAVVSPEAMQQRIASLSPSLISQLDALEKQQAWHDMLRASEAAMARNRLLLRLQRCSATALSQLGPQGQVASLAITAETLALVARLPELMALKIQDGSDLVDHETKLWLQHSGAQAKPALPDTSKPEKFAGTASSSGSMKTPRQCFLARMRNLSDPSFQLEPELSHAAWSALSREVWMQQLETWEPDVALQTYCAEVRALEQLRPSNKTLRRRHQLMRRIAALDLPIAQQIAQVTRNKRSQP